MRRLLLGALALALVPACATRHVPSPPAAADGRRLPEAAELLRALAARRAAIQSVRTLARLAYSSPGESRRAKQVIVAARPDRLRFEVLSPFGTVFVLTADHGMMAAYARGEAVVYRGAASADNLERYASVELPIATAVDLLLGTPPLRADGHAVVSRDDGQIKLWQAGGGEVHVVWWSAALEPARYERRDDQGRVLLRATFGEYAEAPGVRLPTRLSLELPPSQRRIDIELQEPEVNPALADAVFALDTPPGSKEIDLDQVVN